MSADVVRHLNDTQEDALADLFDFLRIPSVSADSAFRADMQRCARFVAESMQRAGLTTEIVPTPGHPIVLGERCEDPQLPTVLIYGHYDVQPPDPLDEWTSAPFDPVIRDEKIYARGATDDKGQLYTHLRSLQAWMTVAGKLPVNVRFLVEGEEEVGSDHLDRFLEEHRDRLQADVAVISDTSQYGDGIPAITYGLRGIVAAEVHLRGPSQDLHSGIYVGSISIPATALARLCGGLLDADGRVRIPGFYDDVLPVSDAERAAFAELPFSEAEFLKETGCQDVWGEAGWSTLERRWIRPTCDINGMVSGYTGEGPKTIIPAWARAKITCRLVPGQQPDRILDALEQFLKDRCPPGLTLTFTRYHGCPAFVLDPTGPWVTAACRAVEEAFGTPPVFIREGGSIPVVMSFRQILDVDTLLLGWGRNSDNLHSPDEHLHVVDFHRGTTASALLWERLRLTADSAS